jgi:N-acetylmuramoyl-L-alanine amidase
MATVGNDKGHGSDTWEKTGGKGVNLNGVVYEEHSFNARVGDALSRHLKRCGIGEVSLQGSNRPEVSLRARTNFYNEKKVDVVISNHANAGVVGAEGICVFAWHNHEPSQLLQKYLVEEYEKMGFKTHGTGEHESEMGSWTELAIVRDTKMTACLIENGFMTNPCDFKKIFLDPTYAEKCAEAQARALCKFFNKKYVPEAKVQAASIPDPSELPIVTSFSEHPRLIEVTRDTGMYEYANLSHSKGTVTKGTRLKVYGETYAAWAGGGGVFIQKKDTVELSQTVITGGLTKDNVDRVEKYLKTKHLEGSIEFVGEGNPYGSFTLKGNLLQQVCEWLGSNGWWYKVL